MDISSSIFSIMDSTKSSVLTRKDYFRCPGELVELLLAPVIYKCLIGEGFSSKDAINSLCARVGIANDDISRMDQVLVVLERRWETSEKNDQQFNGVDMIVKRVSNVLDCQKDKVEWICQQFQQNKLLEASICLAVMAELPEPRLPHSMRDLNERSLLHHVISVDGARLLIELLPCTSLVNSRQEGGFRPIHRASTPELVRFFVSHGADVNSRSRSGFTPLFSVESAPAAMNLLKLGADPMISNTYYRHNALHFTASHGLWDVVWCLLRAGADATLRGKDGYTPLELTAVLSNNPLPSDTSEHLKALTKVKRILEIWDESGVAVTGLFGESAHRRRFEVFEQRCSAAAHSTICKDPTTGLSNATNLPIELTRMILYEYVGVFTGALDLTEGARTIKKMRCRSNIRRTSFCQMLDHFTAASNCRLMTSTHCPPVGMLAVVVVAVAVLIASFFTQY